MADDSRRYPEVLTMILCDTVIMDAHTGKQSIIGCFSQVNAEGFPTVFRPSAAFIELTDGQGHYSGSLRLVYAATEEVLGEREYTIDIPDPLKIVQMHFELPPVPFSRAGMYRLDLLCEGKLLRSRRFTAVRRKRPT